MPYLARMNLRSSVTLALTFGSLSLACARTDTVFIPDAGAALVVAPAVPVAPVVIDPAQPLAPLNLRPVVTPPHTTVKLPDGGLLVLDAATALPGTSPTAFPFAIPTTLPSGFPTALPAIPGMPAIPSGFVVPALPSGLAMPVMPAPAPTK